MIDEIKKKVLFDGEIQDRRVTRWNSTSFEQFLSTANSYESSTSKYLEIMTNYQKDLPQHMLALEHYKTVLELCLDPSNGLRHSFNALKLMKMLHRLDRSLPQWVRISTFDLKLNQSLWFSSMRHKKMYPQVTSTIISLIIWFRSSRRPLLHCVTTTYVASIMAFLVIMGSVFGSIFKTGFHARHVRRGCIHWLYNAPFLVQKSFLSAIVKKGAYFGIVLNSIFI